MLEQELQDSLFPVLREPVLWKGEETKYDHLINGNTDKVISIVTKDYELIQNSEIYEHLKNFEGLRLVELHNFNDTKFYYTFIMDGESIWVGNEELKPTIRVVNSYDRTTSLTFMAGHFRMVCSNGAFIGEILEKFRAIHMGETLKEDLMVNIDRAIEQSKAAAKTQYDLYIKVPVNYEHIVEVVKAFPRQYTDAIIEYTNNHEINNGWDLMNLMTNIITFSPDRNKQATIDLENGLVKIINKILRIDNIDFKQAVILNTERNNDD